MREDQKEGCPFYGFLGKYGGLVRTEGTERQCGALNESGKTYLCQMEARGKPPNWELCHYNSPEARRELKASLHLKVIRTGKKTITLAEWIEQVTSADSLRQIQTQE